MKPALLAALTALAACSVSCGARNPSVAMRPVDAIQIDRVPGEGVVVFVRPDDPCAGGAIVIVNESGEYLGESVPSSHFATTMIEGDHTLVAWDPANELRSSKNPEVNQVGATRVHVEGRRPTYVEVTTRGTTGTGKNQCSSYRWDELTVVGRNHAELDDWLRATRPFAADRGAGQKWIEANAADAHRHVEMGLRELSAREARSKEEPPTSTSGKSPAPAASSAPQPSRP